MVSNDQNRNRQKEFEDNKKEFIVRNKPFLAKANQMRKGFGKTLKYNKHTKCFRKEIKDLPHYTFYC